MYIGQQIQSSMEWSHLGHIINADFNDNDDNDTCPLSVRRPSIRYVSFDEDVVHSTLSRQRRLSMLL